MGMVALQCECFCVCVCVYVDFGLVWDMNDAASSVRPVFLLERIFMGLFIVPEH